MAAWLGLYTPKPRPCVFRYWDGSTYREVDPFVIGIAYYEDEEYDSDKHPKLAAAGDTDALAVTERAARRIFELPPWDEATATGLTGLDVINVHVEYWDFVEDVKKNIE